MTEGFVFIVEYVGQVQKRKICIVSPLNLKKKIIFKTKNFPKSSGFAIRAVGEFTDKAGKIFECQSWQYEKLPTRECFEGYAKTFPDIGPTKAKKIFEKYGADYSVFLDPDKMKEFSFGHYAEIVKRASENEDNTYDIKLMKALSEYGVISPKIIAKVAQIITYEQFKEDPFVLMTIPKVKIGFRACNSIALQSQKSAPQYLKCESRICKGVEFTLRQLLSRGHTYILADNLLTASIRFLNDGVVRKVNLVQENDVKAAINKLRKQHIIKAEKTKTELRFYDAFYYDCENFIAQEITRRVKESSKRPIQKQKLQNILDEFDKSADFKLADSQRLAVESVINNNVAIITGSAGTGKTTVLKASLYALQKLGFENIVLAAPTGRAARRMAESTGHDASTLHSLLHLGIEDEDTDAMDVYVSDEKIEGDAIFIDEASMCDISIIYRLLQKLPKDIKLFFLGDPNQLESVGSGRVLLDLIESYCVPVIKLKFIYRQAKDSNIVMNANKILKGETNLVCGDDFEIINLKAPQDIQHKIAEIYKNEYNKLNDNDIFSVQCICPARREGFLASNQLNKIIQKEINPKATKGNLFFKANGFAFFVGDKIICCKNTSTVKNGDIGVVINVTPNVLTAVFDTGEETFSTDEATDLGISLAYCISVHKSQGSEFDTVIMPVSQENKNMLKRNLFYTAVTRAKRKMILVGESDQIKSAIYNNKITKRNGNLEKRIVKLYKEAM